MARQRLGQHFLTDLDWGEQIARAIRVSPHSTAPLPGDDEHCWIEIGSGHGEITRNLLGAGGPVYAVELDPPLVAGLRRLAKDFANLTVVPGDILKTDLAAIAAGRRAQATADGVTCSRRFAQSCAHFSEVSAVSTAVWATLRSAAEVLELAFKLARVFCALVSMPCCHARV